MSSITGTEAADKLSSSLERPATSTAAASQFVNIPPREPKAVRAWLETLGFSPGQLAGYTDEQILAAYDDALNAEQARASSTAAGSATSTQ